jgi:light-harvesting complex I chlorophyll a/b binding protein 4
MASVSMQAARVSAPTTLCKSGFLTGASASKLTRNVRVGASVAAPVRGLNIQAKKGEWLPGLDSPTYLDGR